MTPYERFWSELSTSDRLDERRWRTSASAEEIQRADDLIVLWYESKDDAERFQEDIERLIERKFEDGEVTASRSSRQRMRTLSLVQQRVIEPDDVRPPLTDEERAWLGLAPKRLLAEEFIEHELGEPIVHRHPKCGKETGRHKHGLISLGPKSGGALAGSLVCAACGRKIMIQPSFDGKDMEAIS